ncbi:MAG: type VI secretion system ATPase TssH [Polyangiaceae bacterium]|nr:type VI secretion system ATPase TssH [Polyangiaceae bacterium]
MSEISRAALFGKLNQIGYKSIESATLFCKMRGNPYVELSHWVYQLLQLTDSDLLRVLRHAQVDSARLARDVTESLDRLPRGASSISDLSVHVEESVERGWVYGSLLFGEQQVRTGHLVIGWLKTTALKNALFAISREFQKIKIDDTIEKFQALTRGSPEEGQAPSTGAAASGDGTAAPAALGKQEALARYTVDLTERARTGEMDPIVGRDEEIRQIVQILLRRRQNNPILTGEAGVGKTAVAEGFAQRIVKGDVPPALKDVSLRTLDIGLLQAGASMKGEFEGRLRQVIDEVHASPKPIILFVDEAHTLIGAGGSQGTGDAANLLKPALARGTLRTIAATTWSEYKKYIESDPALTRRFQTVQVAEPTEARAILMMRSIATMLEGHHKVQVLDEALEAAVKLSKRYIPDRQLPDKSVSLLDTACARVAVSQHAVPPEVEDSRRRIESLQVERDIIARERSIGVDVDERSAEVESALGSETARLAELEKRWETEKAAVDKILAARARLRKASLAAEPVDPAGEPTKGEARTPEQPNTAEQQAPSETVDVEAEIASLKALEATLAELQGDEPLIHSTVDATAIAKVVADWTGIPTGRMVKDEIEGVLRLADQLGRRVLGQDHALEAIARRIQTARAGLENPNKPIGVFMLTGPSGTGKTETALALGEALYGGENSVITINMSEFQESHTVSTLKGAPPGYVGYGEGGVLTEAVRRRPYSVVLLDEVEKAHPDVHEIFFQVFDKGWMEDGEGTRIDFRNTVILLTSNVGTEVIMRACSGPERPDPSSVSEAMRKPLLEAFPAALLGRVVTIPFYPLSDEMIGNIVRLQLGRIEQRVTERYSVPFTYAPSVVELVTSRCNEVESGGRMIDAVLTNTLLPEVSRELLLRTLENKPVQRISVDVADSQFTYAFD